MSDTIDLLLKSVPENPGCYLMKNKYHNIIYVGKAKNLKKRVSSYFNKVHNGKTQQLVFEITSFEYIITSSEKESLILEINLIKKYRPRYNIMFMDDKYYPYIQLTKEEHPRLKIVRNTKNKKALHFGPYPNSGAAYETLSLINKLYPLRKCNKIPKKECLYFHLNQCLAPCIKEVQPESYQEIISKITKFLNGQTQEVINDLNDKMNQSSQVLNFEKALEYKKMIESIIQTTNKQGVFQSDLKNRDYIGVSYNEDYISIQVLMIRNGILINREGKIFVLVDEPLSALETFLAQYYELNALPHEIIIAQAFTNDNIKSILNDKLRLVKQGEHKKMLELANLNAQQLLKQEYELKANDHQKVKLALDELSQILNYSNTIHRIEAFDNSTLQGSNSIGAMVVYEDGYPIKSEYRKFKIISEANDDYTFMKEVLYRRYHRVLVDQLKKPDLIIVDGGLGQLNIALDIVKMFNLEIKVIGLVKDEKHKTSYLIDDQLQEHQIDKKSELFFFLTRIQDEVHRYAITYHRKIRSKSTFKTKLDEVKGLGHKRQALLLKKFKSYEKINNATIEELEDVIPKQVALELYNKVHES
ncbi:MAG: excinuclease ABC subunit UvrC [Bacilli bacterium]